MSLMIIQVTLHAQLSMASELAWTLPSASPFADENKLAAELDEISDQIRSARRECWANGDNVDDIDAQLAKLPTYRSSIASQSLTQVSQTQEANNPTLPFPHDHLAFEPRHQRVTKLDRINFWLLHKLHSLESEAELHKSILRACLSSEDIPPLELVDESAWREGVRRTWFKDRAAGAMPESGLSTNGAVDSSGRPHAERVELGGGGYDGVIAEEDESLHPPAPEERLTVRVPVPEKSKRSGKSALWVSVRSALVASRLKGKEIVLA
jgi:hypothetical protein